MLSLTKTLFRMTMATVAGASNITLTAEGAVCIPYNTLVHSPLSLADSIGQWYTSHVLTYTSDLQHREGIRVSPGQSGDCHCP